MKKRIIRYFGISSITLLSLYMVIMPFRFLDNFYLGGFQYSFHDEIRFKDEITNVVLEPYCFSYVYKFPCIYLYGITGYTRINVIPLYGKVEKIPNIGFYNTIPSSTADYPIKSLKELHNLYGKSIIIRRSFLDIKPEDRIIFSKLQKQGKRKYEIHMEVRRKRFDIYEISKYKKWWNGLDRLNHQLSENINE